MTKHANGTCAGPHGSPPCRACRRAGRERRPHERPSRQVAAPGEVVRVTVRLSPEHVAALGALAGELNTTRAGAVRALLERWDRLPVRRVTSETELPAPAPKKRAARRRPRRPFLAGPVPMDWLRSAGALSGTCARVGQELWHLVGLEKSTSIRVGVEDLARRTGVAARNVARALRQLEAAGRLTVERKAGCKSVYHLPDPYEAP